ncbi:MAG TPA: gluconeogenesis factor YvcK family protein [Candidatus Limnocylindrales bacterium]|nr:gluconeogenesis factor YvcK family protein [Candidatus Limnocylindrales bacterium]
MKTSRSDKRAFRGFRVVALGGGTGLSTLLRGLKEHVVRRSDQHPSPQRPITDLAAIVTVTDDGGSSGRLRRENRVLPPGDIRNCMVALSKDEALLSRLFQYRFHAGRGLRGHNFGNLFLAALTHVTGDFAEAVRVSGKVLAVRGRIFPSTVSNVHLVATLVNGTRVQGETRISRSQLPIRKIEMSPRRVRPLPAAIEAIQQADLILMGPGSLYTSVIPNLLIPEIARAIVRSKAPRIYIANLMTQPGETTHYSLSDHLRAIENHVPGRVIDAVVANRKSISPEVARRYRAEGAEAVLVDRDKTIKRKVRLYMDDLLEEHGVIRHNPPLLARLLVEEFLLSPSRH